MDQIKIGKFISLKRKEKNITQSELAEKLNITDRAISKWENGVCLPDANNMPDLCNILDITINDLFSGEVLDMKDNEKWLEQNLLEMARIKEQRDKELLTMEIFIGVIVSIIMFACIFIASFISMQDWLRIVLIIIGVIPFIIGICYAIRIEQIAGYMNVIIVIISMYQRIKEYYSQFILIEQEKLNVLNVIKKFGIRK